MAAALPLCGEPRAGARILAILAEIFPGRARETLLSEVLVTATQEITDLLAYLPAGLHEQALEAIFRVTDEHRKSALLSGLIGALSEDLLPQAKQLALAIRTPLLRAAALGDVAMRLRDEERTQAFDQVVAALKESLKPNQVGGWLMKGVGLKLGRWS